MEPAREYHPPLTGIRAVAALMVFLHHTVQPGQMFPPWFTSVCRELHTGVPLFFVLSGFLIHQRYHADFSRLPLRILPYLRARFARIYPLFFVLTLLQLIFLSIRYQWSPLDFLRSFLWNASLLKGFSPQYLFSALPQSWSLTVECTFYLLAPVMFLLFRRNFYFLLFISVFALAVCLLPAFPGNSSGFFAAGFTFAGRSFEFLSGCALSVFINNKKQTLTEGWPLVTSFGIAGIFMCIFFLIYLQLPALAGDEQLNGRLINNLILPVFMVLLFRGLLQENSLLRRLLSSPVMQFAGKISYAFFLVQVGLFQNLISHFAGNSLVLQYLLLNLLSAGLYFYIELPCQKYFRPKSLI